MHKFLWEKYNTTLQNSFKTPHIAEALHWNNLGEGNRACKVKCILKDL